MEQTKTRRRRRRVRPPHLEDQPIQPTAFQEAGPLTRPAFGMLDEANLEKLKTRARELVRDYGVVVVHKEAYKALVKAGAKPGATSDRLRFFDEQIDEALAATPKSTVLCGKRPERDLHLPRGDGGFVMRTGTGGHGFVEPETSNYRNMMLDDVKTIAKVANGLDQVGFIAHPFVFGVSELTSDIHGFASMVGRTDKHCWIQPYNKENVEFLMRIATIAAGGEGVLRKRPVASCIVCSFSPLEFKVMDLEAMIQAGHHGMPIHACSLPTAGGTAPLSPSGLAMMAAAEILAMVTMAHVLAPGTPVIATPLMFTLDMRTGSSLQSCVESLQGAAMAIQTVKRGFGLMAHTYGAGSDTPDVDGQSLAERTLICQTVALAGADILGGVGQLECATVFSPVQAVLDNELGAMVRRFIRVNDIDDEELNWAEASQIRTGGHFLDSAHTLNRCRQQHSPDVFMREDRDNYEKINRRTAIDQARDKCMELIKAPDPDGLPSTDALAEIAKVVADADRLILEAAAANKGPRDEI